MDAFGSTRSARRLAKQREQVCPDMDGGSRRRGDTAVIGLIKAAPLVAAALVALGVHCGNASERKTLEDAKAIVNNFIASHVDEA
jgi:hypothetical protein